MHSLPRLFCYFSVYLEAFGSVNTNPSIIALITVIVFLKQPLKLPQLNVNTTFRGKK